jgi:hypothetical protein
MRRRSAFAATATIMVIIAVGVACGLSVEGSADLQQPTADGSSNPPSPLDGLPDGSVVLADGAILLPDGAVVPPPPPPSDGGSDAMPPVIDAGPRPDAATQPPTNCGSNQCSGACFVERCTDLHWITKIGGAAMTNSGVMGGDCVSAAGGHMMQSLTATTDNYRYALTAFARSVAGTSSTIAEIAVGGTTVVSIVSENNMAKICRPASATLPALCVGNIGIGGGSWVGVYGRLSRKQPFGSANLSRGNNCEYNARLDLDIPPSGEVTARFGCVAGANCAFRWYDARIELTPLP